MGETKARVDTKKRGNSSRLTCLEDEAKKSGEVKMYDGVRREKLCMYGL